MGRWATKTSVRRKERVTRKPPAVLDSKRQQSRANLNGALFFFSLSTYRRYNPYTAGKRIPDSFQLPYHTV